MFLNHLCCVAQKAGEAILEHYVQDIEFERKDDASPVTAADMAAHHLIVDALAELSPDIPVISEEHASHVLPAGATRFWLVDPLDGTRSFIRRKGQFTVNIGLIEKGRPTLGVIYIPTTTELYFAAKGEGAWRQVGAAKAQPIATRDTPAEGFSAVVSHSHLDPQTEAFLAPMQIASQLPAASSLKFCRVAEGVADIYPRFGPTMEWDTAAGQAIVEAAGGRMTLPDGSDFTYGKTGFRNGPFVVWGR